MSAVVAGCFRAEEVRCRETLQVSLCVIVLLGVLLLGKPSL